VTLRRTHILTHTHTHTRSHSLAHSLTHTHTLSLSQEDVLAGMRTPARYGPGFMPGFLPSGRRI
jgi:hypothetical protein